MAAPLNTCTTIEQRGVVRFLWAKNMEAKDIHKEMLPIWAAFPLLIESPTYIQFGLYLTENTVFHKEEQPVSDV
jgi:hypothetical protein